MHMESAFHKKYYRSMSINAIEVRRTGECSINFTEKGSRVGHPAEGHWPTNPVKVLVVTTSNLDEYVGLARCALDHRPEHGAQPRT